MRSYSGTSQGNYRFTGAELDTSTGLYHMGARFYDPTIGRWLSEDPTQDKPFEPATLNFYAYVFGNPLLLVDLDGKFPMIPRGPLEYDEGVGGGGFGGGAAPGGGGLSLGGIGAAVKAAADEARALGLTPQQIGAYVERAVAGRLAQLGYSFREQVYMPVARRFVDFLVRTGDSTVALEVKAGRVGWSLDIVRQAWKDITLLATKQVDRVVWFASRNSTPGFIEWLKKMGIEVQFTD